MDGCKLTFIPMNRDRKHPRASAPKAVAVDGDMALKSMQEEEI